MEKIRIGTRGSKLALWQADLVKGELERLHPGLSVERVIIKTEGDRDQRSSLTRIGGQGLFTKAIEDALLENTVDVAVHSLKDLPSKMADGLSLGAVPERGPLEDVLVTRGGIAVQELERGARVATGSIRRRSQLLNLRPDIVMRDLRGNIDTRLRKLEGEDIDAIIMARAALVRLQLVGVKFYTFTLEEMIPAVGQGAIGVQVRETDVDLKELLQGLTHTATFQAAAAERAFLGELDSGCQFPVGAFAVVAERTLKITGFVGSEDGRSVFRASVSGSPDRPADAGRELARKLVDSGAGGVLDRFRNG